MTTVEEILFKMGIDATQMEHAMRQIKEKVNDWARDQIKTLGAIGAGYLGMEGIKRAYEATVDFAEKTIDLSRRLGMSTDAIQVWDYALRKNGGSVEAAAGFFEHLADARDRALAGGDEGKKLIAEFKQLGISVDDLRNKRIEDIASKISEVFKAGGDPQQLIGALREVGGRGAGEMIGALRDGLAEARHEAEQLGLVIDHTTLLKLKEAGEQSVILGNRLKAAFAPWLASMTEGLNYLVDILQQAMAFWGAFLSHLHDHPTDFAGAKAEGAKAGRAEWDKQIERDKGLQRKQDRDELGSGGSTVVDRHEAEKKKAQELDKESDRIEEQGKQKAMTLAERVAYLNLRRLRLQEEVNDKTKTELEHAQARNDLAKINNEYQEALVEKKRREDQLTQDTLEKNRRLKDMKAGQLESLRGPSYWTVEELAKNPMWSFGINSMGVRGSVQDVFSQDAQRIEFLERQARMEARYGNREGADADLRQAQSLRLELDRAGVTKPDDTEKVAREIQDLKQEMINRGIKIQDD